MFAPQTYQSGLADITSGIADRVDVRNQKLDVRRQLIICHGACASNTGRGGHVNVQCRHRNGYLRWRWYVHTCSVVLRCRKSPSTAKRAKQDWSCSRRKTTAAVGNRMRPCHPPTYVSYEVYLFGGVRRVRSTKETSRIPHAWIPTC